MWRWFKRSCQSHGLMKYHQFSILAIHIYWFYITATRNGLDAWYCGGRYCPISSVPPDCSASLFTPNCFVSSSLGLSCGNQGVKHEITWRKIIIAAIAGAILFFLNWWLLSIDASSGVMHAPYFIPRHWSAVSSACWHPVYGLAVCWKTIYWRMFSIPRMNRSCRKPALWKRVFH